MNTTEIIPTNDLSTPQLTITNLELSDLRPYWRNPRANRAAVEKVKQSILSYGYNQPICVDTENVIIVGHARYFALQELGWKKVPVVVLDLPPEKAKAYRIIDNKTAEFATWTPVELAAELRELNPEDMQPYFLDDVRELIAESVGEGLEEVTEEDVEKQEREIETSFKQDSKVQGKEMTCPACGHQFLVK